MNDYYHVEYDEYDELVVSVSYLTEDEYINYRQNGGQWDYYPLDNLSERDRNALGLS
jgi:hypothetical protein